MDSTDIDPSDALREHGVATEPDPRMLLAAIVEAGKVRPYTLNDRFNAISRFELSAEVPKAIRIHFETAKNLYLYGWFVYRFHPVAELQALTSLEFALRERLANSQPVSNVSARPPTLARLLRDALRRKLISNAAFHSRQDWAVERAKARFRMEKIREISRLGLAEYQYDDSKVQPTEADLNYDWIADLVDAVPRIRNNYAHGSETLNPSVLRTFDIVCDLINQLYATRR